MATEEKITKNPPFQKQISLPAVITQYLLKTGRNKKT